MTVMMRQIARMSAGERDIQTDRERRQTGAVDDDAESFANASATAAKVELFAVEKVRPRLSFHSLPLTIALAQKHRQTLE